MQSDAKLRFTVTPASAEKGYRFTWAADAGFVDQVADVIVAGTAAEIDSLDNGNYFVRARAISANGIQGMPVTFAFKRRLNSVKASAGASDDGYKFKWLSDGEGKKQFHFQLFKDKPDGLPIADETSLASDEFSISDLPSGNYFWRVGSVQFLDGEPATNWTSFEKLSVAP